jgi:hypothetical protein
MEPFSDLYVLVCRLGWANSTIRVAVVYSKITRELFITSFRQQMLEIQ